MTRRRMYAAIREALDEEGLEVTPEAKAVADVAVCVALDYVLQFSITVAEELAAGELYSESMVAGVFVRKIKGLMSE